MHAKHCEADQVPHNSGDGPLNKLVHHINMLHYLMLSDNAWPENIWKCLYSFCWIIASKPSGQQEWKSAWIHLLSEVAFKQKRMHTESLLPIWILVDKLIFKLSISQACNLQVSSGIDQQTERMQKLQEVSLTRDWRNFNEEPHGRWHRRRWRCSPKKYT